MLVLIHHSELSKKSSRRTELCYLQNQEGRGRDLLLFFFLPYLSSQILHLSFSSTDLSLTLLSSPHRLFSSCHCYHTFPSLNYFIPSSPTTAHRTLIFSSLRIRQGCFTKLCSVIVSWGLFLAIAFAGYWWYGGSGKAQPHGKQKLPAGSVFVSKKKKRPKKKKAALSNTAPKKAAPNEDSEKVAQSTDDDVAHDEDELQSLQSSGKKGAASSSSAKQPQSQKSQSQKPHLKAPASPFATASQTSSTGADADIDEEEASQLPESGFQQSTSTDPSDMLEDSAPGARVLTITPSTQPPRTQKQRSTTPTSQSGTQSAKNAKKKEKKKMEKEAERADQKARFEQHRASKSKPSSDDTMVGSAWITVNGKRSSTPTNAPAAKLASGDLLDTFVSPDTQAIIQRTSGDSEDDRNVTNSKDLAQAQDINDSLWETVPAYLAADWSEVQRKGRKQKKAAGNPDAGKSGDESATVESTKVSYEAKPERPTVSKKEASKKETSKTMASGSAKSGNGFQLLDTGSTTSDTKNSSSDWAEVDDSDNWAVHTGS
ncbi:hypothetical protein L873DRAFT_1831471 [Choiromyces venosus 120613-1]|uniref:Uncharacterized protein n=1 Tax=Choiromyces venosus 120613-1 TaxID=1336337 RepID=A0A3N4IZB4_9PEZI|nr:hypothetical protein L873DRAFT_1831471 [Choiromyces venosus 120613-1]